MRLSPTRLIEACFRAGGERQRAEEQRLKDAQIIDALRRRAEMLERHKREFFCLIESIERQRDEWRDIHHESVGQYHAALAVLERELKRERVRIARLLVHTNSLRKEKGLEPIETPKQLDRSLGVDADPVGLASQYQQAMDELRRQGSAPFRRRRAAAGQDPDRPADIAGAPERDRLAGEHADESERP